MELHSWFCGLPAVEAVLWACVASTGLFVGCERPGSWVLGDDSRVESAPALCWFAALGGASSSVFAAAGAAQFGCWLCPQWGVSRAEAATCAGWSLMTSILSGRNSCWRGRNSRDGALLGSPIAGRTRFGGLRPLPCVVRSPFCAPTVPEADLMAI